MAFVFVLFFVWFAIIVGLGLWIVWPIERIARRRNRPVRYSIADFLCLFVTIQLPLGILTWYSENVAYFDDERIRVFRMISGLLCILGVVIWWGAVRAISFCGLYRGWRRILFLGVIVPVVYYGLVPFSVMVLVCVSEISAGNFTELWTERRWVGAWTVFLGCALYVCGVVNRKVVLAERVAGEVGAVTGR